MKMTMVNSGLKGLKTFCNIPSVFKFNHATSDVGPSDIGLIIKNGLPAMSSGHFSDRTTVVVWARYVCATAIYGAVSRSGAALNPRGSVPPPSPWLLISVSGGIHHKGLHTPVIVVMLSCKAKRRYLLTFQVSRYRLLPLHCSMCMWRMSTPSSEWPMYDIHRTWQSPWPSCAVCPCGTPSPDPTRSLV